MKKNICNICGGNLINKNGRWCCEACGAFPPEEITNEEINLLYNASQKLRLGDFDYAEEMYSDITRQYPTNADAFWGLTLSQYGIKYEKDYDGKMIPTCFNASYESLYDNINYKKAYELADNDQKKYFKSQADKIELVRKEWIDIASKEEQYDIFLSYKATEIDSNQKTEDSFEAHEIYSELTKLGYRVFFSKEALSDKTGEHYEPYIFNALNTCHVMIVYASKAEYVNSTWVRNEWLRYYKKIKNKEKLDNSLILIYKGFNPSVLPRPLSNTQNLDRDDIRFANKLESYLSRVITEAKKTIPHIDSITIKHIDIDDKKIESINKRELKGIKAQEAIHVDQVFTREIGTFSSPKLTSKAEDQLNLGYIYLKKSCFDDAINCFDGIIINNKTNGKAILGKLLGLEKCVDLNNFLNKDFSSFDNFELLAKSIDYLPKDESELILSKLIEKVFKFVEKKNITAAKNIYIQICEYNIDTIQSSHLKLISSIIKKNIFNDDSYSIFNTALKFLLNNDNDYKEAITNLILALIDNDKIKVAELYFADANKYYKNDIMIIKLRYCLNANTSDINKALFHLINNTDASDFDAIINNISVKTADELLCLISDYIINNFDNLDSKKRFDFSKLIIQYNFSKSSFFDNALIVIVLAKPCEENDGIFNLLINTFNNRKKRSAAKLIAKYSQNYAQIGVFEAALRYINLAISLNQKNVDLLKKKILYSLGAKDDDDLSNHIYKLDDFSLIERFLSLCSNDDEMSNEISSLCNCCIKYIDCNNTVLNNNVFIVFDQLIRYFPESTNNILLPLIQRIADLCKEKKLFKQAENYYSMMTGLDSSKHIAYWGLLQSKLNCRNNDELIHQKVLLSSIPEFNNAIIAAGNNLQAVEDYIDCKAKQEKWLKKDKNLGNFSKRALVLFGVFVAIIIIFYFSIHILYINPNTKYNDALESLNTGHFTEAYEKFSLLDYKDASSQILIAKAGMAFENGNYEEGIQNIYDAGGTIEIKYDGNGGSISKSSETIKKQKGFVDNNPSLYGHEFNGWTINNFSIESSYKKYYCNVSLQASWEIANYSISYKLNGGALTNNKNNYNCTDEDFSLGYPYKRGYTFIGWSGTDIDGTQKDVTITKGSAGNKLFEAHYTANKYTITYDYGYDNKISRATVTYDSIYRLVIPERTGYIFKGWENDLILIAYRENNIDRIWKQINDVVLHAIWEKVD